MIFKRKESLSFKLILWVSVVTTIAIGGLTYVNLQTKKKYLMEEVTSRTEQLSDVIVRSLWYDMLHNYRDALYHSIKVIGEQEGIVRVRIFNKEGIITYSSDRKEIGHKVDMKAEACYACHARDKPLEKLDLPKRTRIFKTPQGRVHGMITPIYNEPACWQAPCHAHPPEKRVLGVLDVVLSLKKTDERIRRLFYRTIPWAVITVVLISFIISFFFRKYIYKPTKKLLEATKRVANGDFGYYIPVTSKGEIADLTFNFNIMVEKLKKYTEELEEVNKQLLQAEKLAALGKLAASVAHEINNPLSGVLTYIKLMQKKLNKRDDEICFRFNQYLSTMEKEIERCSAIVKNLLDFARKREPSLKEGVNINDVIEETIKLISNRLNLQNICLEKDLGELPPIVADPAQLRQAFLNLLINAAEAIHDSTGKITIRTRYLPDEKMVMVEISDTGVGIKEEDLGKIFDPFFTTKEKGTGLGLSVVYGIINAHKGHISVKSKVGKGTTFTIKLPLELKEA
jgi:two-component system NtrC family sensor kinase